MSREPQWMAAIEWDRQPDGDCGQSYVSHLFDLPSAFKRVKECVKIMSGMTAVEARRIAWGPLASPPPVMDSIWDSVSGSVTARGERFDYIIRRNGW